MSDENTNHQDPDFIFGHYVPDEYGGGFCYQVTLKSGQTIRAIDARNFKQILDLWLERKKGVVHFQGTVDGSGEGSAVFEGSEIAAIRYATIDDDLPWVEKDDDEDDDDGEGDGEGGEPDPPSGKVASLADFKTTAKT